MKIAIVGEGASGLVCAIELLKKNNNVVIFEKNDFPGKKLSITGNGKGNICNLKFGLEDYYNENKAFLNTLFGTCPIQETLNLLKECGLEFYDKDGYVYPLSNSAKSVVYALNDKVMSYKNCKVYNKEITSIDELKDFDKIIIATGGLSYKKTGTTGLAYKIAKKMGHNIIEPGSALSSVLVNNNIKKVAGVRVNALASLFDSNEKIVYQEEGNVQINSESLSGIPIMNLSRYISRNKNEKYKIILDLIPKEKDDTLFKKFIDRKSKLEYRDDKYFLSGILDDKLGEYILENINSIKLYNNKFLNDNIIKQIVEKIKKLKFEVIKCDDINNAQVTTGGIDLKEINEDFSSKLNAKIHFIGECLDVDGKCGGYNLAFAFTSGIQCARLLK